MACILMFSSDRRRLSRVSMLVVRPEQGHICLVLLVWGQRLRSLNYVSGVVPLMVSSRWCRVPGSSAKHCLGATLWPLRP